MVREREGCSKKGGGWRDERQKCGRHTERAGSIDSTVPESAYQRELHSPTIQRMKEGKDEDEKRGNRKKGTVYIKVERRRER